MGLAYCGKAVITLTFGVVCVLSAELFPTCVRTSGIAAATCIARFGAIAAPWVAMLGISYTATDLLDLQLKANPVSRQALSFSSDLCLRSSGRDQRPPGVSPARDEGRQDAGQRPRE